MVGVLILAGHRIDDVKKYSIRQIEAFFKLVRKENLRDNRSLANIIRTAFHADKKAFATAMKEVGDDLNAIDE